MLSATYATSLISLGKMAAILADGILKSIFLNENVRISIQILLKFVPKSLIDYKSVLIQVMAWCRTGAIITWSMINQVIHAHVRHEGICVNEM